MSQFFNSAGKRDTSLKKLPKERPCIKNITATYYSKMAKTTVIMTSRNKIAFIRGGDGIDMGPYDRKHYFSSRYIPKPIDAAFNHRMFTRKGNKEHTIFLSNDK